MINASIATQLKTTPGDNLNRLAYLMKLGYVDRNTSKHFFITDKGKDFVAEQLKNNLKFQEAESDVKIRTAVKYFATSVAGLIASLELTKTASATSTTSSAILSSTVSSPIISTSTATSSILTTKTVLASIVATIMVTGGIAGPYAVDSNMFGNSVPDDINTTNGNIDSSPTLQNSHSATSFSDTGTSSSKSVKSNVSSNSQSATTSQFTQTQSKSQENSLENTQNNDSQTTDSSAGSSSGPTTPLIPSVTPLSQLFPKNAISTSTTDIKVDKSNNIWVADRDNNQVRKLNSQGETVLVIGGTTTQEQSTIIPTSGSFDILSQNIQLLVMPYAYAADDSTITLNQPTRLAIDNSPAGDTVHVYIVDSGNKRILKIDQDGNHIPEFRFYCSIESTQSNLCKNYNNSEIFDLNIVTSTDGNYLYVTTGNTNSNAKDLSSNFHAFHSDTGSLAESENSNLNLTNAVTRNNYIYALDDVVGAIIKFNSDEIIDIPLKDSDNNSILPFSFTVDKSEEFIYVFDLFGTLYQYDTNGTLLDSQKYDGFISGMDIDSEGNILALDVVNEQITTISFEDAIEHSQRNLMR